MLLADAATDTRLYSIWENMKTRCYNKNAPKYAAYGAKGIRVCKEWKENFASFHDWAMKNGYENTLSLDRINTKGNYEPSNCRWANDTEQANNKTNSRKLSYQGEELSISELSKKTGIAEGTLYGKTDGEIKELMQKKEKHKKAVQTDSISVDQTYYTTEGYLVDHPIVTTCGIFEYKNEDGSIRRELRLPEDVFDETSLESYKGKPIIITHDAGEVDKENVHKEQIGTIIGKGFRDGENVRCEIIIHDTNALKRCGLKELSLGYSVDKEETPGVYQGERYDCIQKNIEINHLALVSEARAGETARLNIDRKDVGVNNSEGGIDRMEKENPKGYQESQERDEANLSPEELEAAIALFKAQQAASQVAGSGTDGAEEETGSEDKAGRSPSDQVREHKKQRDSNVGGMDPEKVIAEQESDIDMLLAEIDRLQAAHDMNGDEDPTQEEEKEQPEKGKEAVLGTGGSKEKGEKVNMDAVDKIIQERLDVCRMADKLHLDGMEGLPVMEGRKRIIRAVNPKINLDGKSDAYITAAYDIAKQSYQERKSTDEQFQSMTAGSFRKDSREESRSGTARKTMITRMIGGKE